MTIMHSETPRPFKPTEKGGGSKKGKAHSRWPWVLKIVAHAVIINWKGTMEAHLANRKGYPKHLLKERMDTLCPGWSEWYRDTFGERVPKTKNSCAYTDLLDNRVYKMYYSGSSDRGKDHDPNTRAAPSKEHYLRRIPTGDPLLTLHEDVRRGKILSIPDWKSYIRPDEPLSRNKTDG